jgi:hypothetical protein
MWRISMYLEVQGSIVDIVSRVFFSDPFNFDVKEDHIALDIDLP